MIGNHFDVRLSASSDQVAEASAGPTRISRSAWSERRQSLNTYTITVSCGGAQPRNTEDPEETE